MVCLALHTDDFGALQRLTKNKGLYGGRRRADHAIRLIKQGDPLKALRWLELELGEHDTLLDSDSESLNNLRLTAAARAGEGRSYFGYCAAAFTEQFTKASYERLVSTVHPSGPPGEMTKSHILNLTRRARGWPAAEYAFRLLLLWEEWSAAEQLYLENWEFPPALVGQSDEYARALRLASVLGTRLPDVCCGILRGTAKLLLHQGKKFDLAKRLIERSIGTCPAPEYHTTHETFLLQLAKDFPSNKQLQGWIAQRVSRLNHLERGASPKRGSRLRSKA